MNITRIQPVEVSRSGSLWTFTVKYTATFTPEEVRPPLDYTFQESIQIWEEDSGFLNSDDRITGWVSARNFNPSGTSETRELKAVIRGRNLDTELGAEEIYAKIQLRNFSTGGVPIVRRTATVPISP